MRAGALAWMLGTLLATGLPVEGQLADLVLVPHEASWRFRDDGVDPGAAWWAGGYDDRGWPSGPGPLGHAHPGLGTDLGADPGAPPLTTYFRHTFRVPDPATIRGLTLRVLRDAGAVVYLNGVEVLRTNLTAGTVTTGSPALAPIEGLATAGPVATALGPDLLVPGLNTLAVEVHRASPADPALLFALELVASERPLVTRGPYLQRVTPVGLVLRWRTSVPTVGTVRLGPAPRRLAAIAAEPDARLDHEVPVTGLRPDTRYYYAVGTPEASLAGDDAFHSFVTPPVAGSTRPVRAWVLGDTGTAGATADAVRRALLEDTGTGPLDLLLLLGDNAYQRGTDVEYQRALFDPYAALLRRAPLWPALGNHDAASVDVARQVGPYFDAFTLPAAGETGGPPSGSEAYYAFDVGQVHFVVLDSSGSDRTPGSPMLDWLAADLQATRQPWIVALWHHPPYSHGFHDSDREPILVEMRENVLPILEAAGVDLVLTGHSHDYERSVLLDGHYGPAATLGAAMVLDGGDGREDGGGPYRKPAGRVPHAGAVYVVAGSASAVAPGPLDHPAMAVSLAVAGALRLEVDGPRLDAVFLDRDGVIRDRFTLLKGSATGPVAPVGLETVASRGAVRLRWTDRSADETGFLVERSEDGVAFRAIGRTGPDVTTFLDRAHPVDGHGYYRVRALGPGGASWPSNAVAAPGGSGAAATGR